MAKKAVGKMKFFDVTKGWGFLVEEGTKKEYFVHWKNLVNADKNEEGFKVMYAEDKVSFIPDEREGKLTAREVELIA